MFGQSTSQKFRYIFSGTLSARENMAIDKVLFQNFDENSLPIFRLYDWEESCTIGISQTFENIENIQEYKNSYAKRITGGGVLFHGHDISYSLIIPKNYMKSLSVKASYEKTTLFLFDFYKSLGLNVQYAKDDDKTILSKNELCQVGFEPYDILVDGKKVGGNAQRRDKKNIFQHGSIPLKKVKNKKEVGYALEDFEIFLSVEEAKDKVAKIFEKSFNIRFEKSQLTTLEKEELKILL